MFLAWGAAWLCLLAVQYVHYALLPEGQDWSMAFAWTCVMLPVELFAVSPAALTCTIMHLACLRSGEKAVSIRQTLVVILASTVGLGLSGCLIGYLLGRFAPGYYRAVFRNGNDPQFDPVEVGIGLGLTQGIAAGLAVRALVVLAVAWYRSRAPRSPD